MTPQEKEIDRRRDEIKSEVREVFMKNIKIVDIDIPEPDNRQAANLIVAIMQEALNEIKTEVDAGKYDNY